MILFHFVEIFINQKKFQNYVTFSKLDTGFYLFFRFIHVYVSHVNRYLPSYIIHISFYTSNIFPSNIHILRSEKPLFRAPVARVRTHSAQAVYTGALSNGKARAIQNAAE